MLTIDTLQFEKNAPAMRWQCRMEMTLDGEDFTVSIIAGPFCYSTPRELLDDWRDYTTMEMAIMKIQDNGEVTYNDENFRENSDVLTYRSLEEILTILNEGSVYEYSSI